MPAPEAPSERRARTKRMVSAGLAAASNVGVFILYQLVSLPVFLASYGDRLYSDWLILYSLPALLSASDLGVPDVVASQMTMFRSAGRLPEAARLYRRTRILATYWLAVLIPALIGTVWITNPAQLLHLHFLHAQAARLALTALLVWLAMNLYWGIYSAAYESYKRVSRNLSFIAWTRAAEFTVIIAAVAFGASVPLLAALLVLTRFVATLAMARDVRAQTPWYQHHDRPSPEQPDFRMRSLISPAVASLAFPAGNAIQNQGLLIVVGWQGGAALVVIVNSLRTITNAVYQFNSFIKAGVTPELSDRFGANDIRAVRDIAEKVTAIITGVNLVLAIGITIVGSEFLYLWSGGRLHVGVAAVALFAASSTTDCLWHSMSNVPQAKNVHQKIAAAYLVACLAALPLAYLLLPPIGLLGVAVSLFTTSVVGTVVTVPSVCRLLDVSVSCYMRDSVAYLRSLLSTDPRKLLGSLRSP